MIRACACVVLGLTVSTLGACAPYVNIPAQGGDVAANNPNLVTTANVIAAAVKAAAGDQPFSTDYAIVLPQGSTDSTYEFVIKKMGPGSGAVWYSQGVPEGTPTVKVKQIRIRGAEAEVDIERPSEGGTGGGTPTLMTAYLQWEVFTGWHAQRLRIWRIGVDAVGSIP